MWTFIQFIQSFYSILLLFSHDYTNKTNILSYISLSFISNELICVLYWLISLPLDFSQHNWWFNGNSGMYHLYWCRRNVMLQSISNRKTNLQHNTKKYSALFKEFSSLQKQNAIEIKYYYIGVTQLRMRHKCNNPTIYIMYNVYPWDSINW